MNPTLHRLGFSATDRVVIFHADDIGSSHSSLAAYAGLLSAGILSSAATMAPCPWFPATAAFCRRRQGNPALDMGVHLTLNCEWDDFRWGPISTRDPASGLMDDEGYFHRREPAVVALADLAAVEVELRAQVERALAAGIDVTHLDSHMLTLFDSRFWSVYFGLAEQYRLPAFILRPESQIARAWGLDWVDAPEALEMIRQLEDRGFPVFDHLVVLPLEEHEHRLQVAKAALAALPAGLSYFLIHPSQDTPELRAFADDWRARVADYELFTSDAWREAIAESGVHVIGWRTLREVLRNS